MAVKKKETSKPSKAAASPKAAPKQAAAKKKASASASASASPAVATETAAKVGTPKAAAPKKAAAAPKKAAAPIKLSDSQKRLLEAIQATKDEGYLADKKGESKTLESLSVKKLIKRGAKDKTSGTYRYTMSKAGEKHLGSTTPTA